VPELAGVVQPSLILLNDDDAGYVLVRFDPRSLRMVLESVGELPGAAARAVCWNAVIDMTRQGELPVPTFAAMLARGMAAEPSLLVLQALHSHAAELITRLADVGQAREAKPGPNAPRSPGRRTAGAELTRPVGARRSLRPPGWLPVPPMIAQLGHKRRRKPRSVAHGNVRLNVRPAAHAGDDRADRGVLQNEPER
jgi:hypothetical protein